MSSITARQRTKDSVSTRETLLERLKNCQDQSSWQQFYELYRDLIYGFALKAGLTESEAEDVLQETVIGVTRKLPRFKLDPTRCSFRTWLLTQTTWRIRDQIRKRLPLRRSSARFGPSATRDGTDGTATVDRIPDLSYQRWETEWEEDWKKAVIKAALNRVKQDANLKDCQMFDLHVLRGMRSTEVARALGVSVSRVYLAKHRVGKRVKEQVALIEKEAF